MPIVLGMGNCGMLLASMFDKNPILFSTALEDTKNFNSKLNVNTVSNMGASKRFSVGVNIWNANLEKIKKALANIKNEKVFIFSSLGGGSGSSSLVSFSKVLLENNNKVLIFGIFPFKKEYLPATANAVSAINALMPIISQVTVMLFDNEKLRKICDNDWVRINSLIISRADYVVNLLNKYSDDEAYSPLTLDQSELESVIFGGGFIDFSDTFLEESMPKFEYGAIDKTTKNCLVAMYVDINATDANLAKHHRIFTEVMSRIATRARNARIVPGILRTKVNHSNSENKNIKDRAYMVIASGLNIDRYLVKLAKIKDSAVERAKIYSKEYKGKKVIKKSEDSVLDI